ncbi:MAG: hypothetical protein GY796_02315 [Chloroflexi bacterium]|nr:hypothetical protein [Chloroflexota bacterium]
MQTIIIGLDAFEPGRFERLYNTGQLPNLGKYVATGGYSRFSVSNPPQSEVSWTSIATGLNPGGHGMFDFVHRNPQNYALHVSLLPTKSGLGGTQFTEPFKATTIFDQAVKQGYPATALWWPAMFPARVKSSVRTLPGLGTPDLLGRFGVGTFLTTNLALGEVDGRKTPVAQLEKKGSRYIGSLTGPMRKKKGKVEPSQMDVVIEPTGADTAVVTIDNFHHEMQIGEWSPIIEMKFKMGLFISIKAITRVILTKLGTDVCLYAMPLQAHPLGAPWHYGTPRNFVKESWQKAGPYLTVGWPQDTTALEDGFINDEQFLKLCDFIVESRLKVLMYYLDRFEEGVLASVFDTLDRLQHMFWRDRPDLIDAWYVKLDGIVGQVEDKLARKGLKNKTQLFVISDHGFSDFEYKVHLNRWLCDHHYITPQETKESATFSNVNWAKSQAYAIGLNSLYLNLDGREGQGTVQAGEKEALLNRLCTDLTQWQGPDGRAVFQHVWRQEEAFDGPLTSYGPDLVLGFASGYRASAETALGGWEKETIVPNKDHWASDHCIDYNAVPGVLFSSQGLKDFPNPSYKDIPYMTIGTQPDSSGSAPPPTSSNDEDEAVIEERLKSLGYL